MEGTKERRWIVGNHERRREIMRARLRKRGRERKRERERARENINIYIIPLFFQKLNK